MAGLLRQWNLVWFKVSNSMMYDVLHVPKLACNLVKFGRSRCWIRGPKRTLEGMDSLKESAASGYLKSSTMEKAMLNDSSVG